MASTFSIRNISCDYYLASSNDFNKDQLGHLKGLLPTLRIFGIVEQTGYKCCAHIHGVFPYLLLKISTPLNAQLEELIRSIVGNIVGNVPPNQDEPIALIKEVEAKSIYGYTTKEDYFVQIYFKHPRHVQIVSLEFQKQTLSNSNMQPYYSHIPYVLQFFIQYDIFGMDLVHFREDRVHFRSPPKNLVSNILRCLTSPMLPSTRMEVEFDVYEDAILNSSLIADSQFVNKGLKLIYTDELARSTASQEVQGLSPGGIRELPSISKTELDYIKKLKEYCQSSSQTTSNLSSDSASSQLNTFSQVNETFLNCEINKNREEVSNLDEFDMWNDMELQVRGFEEDVEEDYQGNEEILLDSDEDTNDNQMDTNYLNLNIESKKSTVRKSGVIRPIYPKVSSSAKDDEDLVQCTNRPNKRQFNLNFDEIPLTQAEYLSESTPKIQPETEHVSNMSDSIQHLSAMAIEVMAFPTNKNEGIANPETDPIQAIGIAICSNVTKNIEFCYEKIILVSDPNSPKNEKITFVENEAELFKVFVDIINKFDPDILIGYDLLRGSFAYLCDRATSLQNFDFLEQISRIKNARISKEHPVFIGRIKLELWRVVRRESPMRSYSLSSLVAILLKKPFPELQLHDLMRMNELNGKLRLTAALHYLEMAKYDILVLDAINVFVRTSQMARVFGIQFSEVLSRGSQFRVESMLLRVVKELLYLPPSISVEQRNRMDSPLTIPLNLEPISGIYRDPVGVLDFQSLYPSVCIAYNYCFSTCLGKISEICNISNQRDIKLGALEYATLPIEELKNLIDSDLIHVSPTGGVFVKQNVKLGALPLMLKELLDTRLMVKNSMKRYKNNRKFYRMLDAQQLALKLVSNVTYGYTAANWSGRMPCDVVADAIVSKGREALENAIHMINSAPSDKYNGATVIYGDTDSCFVLFKGCSRAKAFELGRKIAEDVTSANPYPMKLKFEKIMQPCVLLTKKRYVGNSYENSPEDKPKFDAKGIETVRRDSCLFVSKLMEKCLKVLFENDAYTAINYLRLQLEQLKRFPISDFILHAEFRGEYSNAAVIPIKKLALERKEQSSRLMPVHGERLPFVIIQRSATNKRKLPLIDCVVSWQNFLANNTLQINYNYYVSRPLFGALSRVFDMVPVKLNWRPIITSNLCLGCKKVGISPFCGSCTKSTAVLQRALTEKSVLQRQRSQVVKACNECISRNENLHLDLINCSNMNCDIMEKRLDIVRSQVFTAIESHGLYKVTNKPIYLSD